TFAESRGYLSERQDETGLFYLHARYYDPALGRFVSADPTIPTGSNVHLNRYAYASNNPIGRLDPGGYDDGEEGDSGGCGGGGLEGGGYGGYEGGYGGGYSVPAGLEDNPFYVPIGGAAPQGWIDGPGGPYMPGSPMDIQNQNAGELISDVFLSTPLG